MSRKSEVIRLFLRNLISTSPPAEELLVLKPLHLGIQETCFRVSLLHNSFTNTTIIKMNNQRRDRRELEKRTLGIPGIQSPILPWLTEHLPSVLPREIMHVTWTQPTARRSSQALTMGSDRMLTERMSVCPELRNADARPPILSLQNACTGMDRRRRV